MKKIDMIIWFEPTILLFSSMDWYRIPGTLEWVCRSAVRNSKHRNTPPRQSPVQKYWPIEGDVEMYETESMRVIIEKVSDGHRCKQFPASHHNPNYHQRQGCDNLTAWSMIVTVRCDVTSCGIQEIQRHFLFSTTVFISGNHLTLFLDCSEVRKM